MNAVLNLGVYSYQIQKNSVDAKTLNSIQYTTNNGSKFETAAYPQVSTKLDKSMRKALVEHCGVRRHKSSGRIVGGKAAQPGKVIFCFFVFVHN